MFEGIRIKIDSTDMLIEQGNDCSFHPYQNVENNIKKLNQLPDYCNGLIDLEGEIYILINFHHFLGSSSKLENDEKCIYQVRHELGNFAFIIPNPELFSSETIPEISDDNVGEIEFIEYPFIHYLIHVEEIKFIIFHEELLNYLTTNISINLTKSWREIDLIGDQRYQKIQKREYRVDSHQVKPSRGIEKSQQQSSHFKCRVNNFQFLISQSIVKKISTKDEFKPTSIPNSPPWIIGVINYNEKSIPLINIPKWLDVDNSDTIGTIILICESSTDLFAIPATNVDKVRKIKKVKMFHHQSLSIDHIPYRNIQYDETGGIYQLNVEALTQSIKNDTISDQWMDWKDFFSIEKIELAKNDQTQTDQTDQIIDIDVESFKLNHPKIKLILTFSNEIKFSEMREYDAYPFLPSICEGLIRLEGQDFILINLFDLLELETTHFANEDQIIAKLSMGDKNIALQMPMPGHLGFDLNSALVIGGGIKLQDDFNLPITNYVLTDTDLYLHLREERLLDYIKAQITTQISNKMDKWAYALTDYNTEDRNYNQYLENGKEPIGRPQYSKKANKMTVLIIRGHRFAFEEDRIIEIANTSFSLTKLPNTPDWVDGIFEYDNTLISKIDMESYLEFEDPQNLDNQRDEKSLQIIVQIGDGAICLSCEDITTYKKEELKSFQVHDIDKQTFPFKNILISKKGEIIFHINLSLFSDLTKKEVSIPFETWVSFLSSSYKFETSDTLSKGLIPSMSSDIVLLKMGGNQFVIPKKNIREIRNTQRINQDTYNDLVISRYNNKWIPHFELNYKNNQKNYSVVIKENEELIEMEVEDIEFLDNSKRSLSSDKIQHLVPTQDSPVNSVYSTKNGIAFEFNGANYFSHQMKSILGEKMAEFEDFDQFITNHYNSHYKFQDEREKSQTGLFNTWDQDVEIFLIFSIRKDNKEEKYAIPINSIQYFSDTIEDVDTEKMEWNQYMGSTYIYLVTETEGEEKAYRVPQDSNLHSISKDCIQEKEDGDYIDLEGEVPIQIKKLANGG